jgi:hypothetical protein
MDKRDSLSEPGEGREPSHDSVSDRGSKVIEFERTRLMKADAVLGSVAFSLTYAEWRCENGPDYASVVEVAREIVQESIRRLDPVSLEQVTGEHVLP